MVSIVKIEFLVKAYIVIFVREDELVEGIQVIDSGRLWGCGQAGRRWNLL